eukprot:m.9767 g.9767  ORF g.9767 m.9767 type:complete len:54 (+) comp4219_c0_seq1:2718-2879(+)
MNHWRNTDCEKCRDNKSESSMDSRAALSILHVLPSCVWSAEPRCCDLNPPTSS